MPTVPQPQLWQLAFDIIRRLGSEEDEARIVAEHLVNANLAGHDSHGVGLLPTYATAVACNALRPNTAVEKIKDRGSILQFDAHRGYGQVAARQAMQEAIERAKDLGLCLMTIRNAHHIARIGSYGEQAANAGLISIHFVNVTDLAPAVVPWGGRKPAFVTNPVCIAIPGTDKQPMTLLDMATSHIAYGKTRVAYNAGKKVAFGTVVDHEGHPSDDPAVIWEEPHGALAPTGEHKGSGLALMCEMLGGVMSGHGTIADPGNDKHMGGIVNSMFTLVVDPAELVDLPWAKQEIDATLSYVRGIEPSDPQVPVIVAGDKERTTRAERLANGIPVDDTTWAQLQALV